MFSSPGPASTESQPAPRQVARWQRVVMKPFHTDVLCLLPLSVRISESSRFDQHTAVICRSAGSLGPVVVRQGAPTNSSDNKKSAIYDLQWPEEAAMKTILVPLDGSALAERVLPYARMLARTLDARLHLLRVVVDSRREHRLLDNPTVRAEAGKPAGATERESAPAWDALRQFAENNLDEHAAQLRAAGLHVTS